MRQRGFFGLSEHLEALSRDGDPLEVLDATVDFEYFRGWYVTFQMAEVAVPHALLRDILERIDRLRRPTPATA